VDPGVTFYNTSSSGWSCPQSYSYAPVTISGQVTANLSAPTSGSLNGILFFGNRAGCSTPGSCIDQINGGSTAVLNGALYFASDEIEITGSNVNGFLMLVADKIYINGNSNFGNNGDPFDGVTVNVFPASASLYASQTQQFTATVGNTANPAVTWSISPSSSGTISSSGLYTAPSSVTAQQAVTVTATSQDDDTKYGTATVTLYPPRTTPAISWAAPAPIGYGTALSAAQLDATTSVAGTFAYSPAIGSVLSAGLQTLTVTFTPSNTFLYNSASANVPVTVIKATPTVTWPTPSPMAYGTPLSPTQLDASALIAGSFGYTPVAGAVLTAGAHSLSVTFTPSDAVDYNTVTQSVQLTVNPVAPTITFTVANQTYGVAPFTVAATSNSPGAISYSVISGPATITGSTVTITGVGAVVLQASQAASGNYTAGTSTASFAVAAEGPTIAFSVANQTYGAAPFTVAASSNSAGAFTYSVISGPATVSGSTVTITGVGAVVLQASQAASGNYTAGTQTASFTVAAGAQTITFPAPASPVTNGVSPVALSASSSSGLPVSFSVVSGPATISGSTLTINGPGTVVVAANQGGNANYAAATQVTQSIVVNPPISVTITPSNATLNASQTLQFTAAVTNTGNTGVNWTISPTGIGTVDQTGFYTAPALIPAQQTVTLTATSQADTTKSASATITLIPTQCVANGYGYQRVIVIDHTKVQNSDQVNFPFLFSTTDIGFKSTANGGHVTSSSGYDIIFTSDPAGQDILNYEIEEYDPVAGQVVAWVQIPTLSHSANTVIYAFYGNSSITASQQNPASVWDSNFVGVWHLPNGTILSANDSTAYGNNGTISGVTSASGEIDGAASFNGESDASISLPTSGSEWNFSVDMTLSAWVKTTGNNLIVMQLQDDNPLAYLSVGPTTVGGNSNDAVAYFRTNTGGVVSASGISVVNDGHWHQIEAVRNTGQAVLIYVDGLLETTTSYTDSGQISNSGGVANIGGGGRFAFNGSIDEARISNIARNGDWIATEYKNQSSPSTFYRLYSENAQAVLPATTSLYASQTQQFTATGSCGSNAIWSLPVGALGALTTGGLYTAPAGISSKQTVTITATSPANGTVIGTAVVTLLPPPAPIALVGANQPPYTTGSSQGFVATLLNQSGVPEPGVAVTFKVNGANSTIGSATTDTNGIASYAYIGSNSGTDTIQANATVSGQPVGSNSVTVNWIAPVTATTEGSVALSAGPTIGLIGLLGAFTDANGTVIEPIAVGASPRTFVVPQGATQFQLGVDDDNYPDNAGAGFTVEVNGTLVTVPPTAQPWSWNAGGLNSNYQFGLNNGTNPIVAATGLTLGQEISVVYESGTASWGLPGMYNANGDPGSITGLRFYNDSYFPTLYLTSNSYPVGQPISFSALVTDGSGTALPNVPVTLSVSGANNLQAQATTNSTGTATFTYIGASVGTDVVQARAYPSGQTSLVSSPTTVTWTSYTTPPPAGSLTLLPSGVLPALPAGGQQAFSVLAVDAYGAPISGATISLLVTGVDNLTLTATTDVTGHASFVYQNVNPGVAYASAAAFVQNASLGSAVATVPWTLPPATTTASGGNGSTINIGINALSTIALPNTLQLTGTVTDSNLPAGSLPNITWSQVSGPGAVTFTTPQQAVTTASFSQAGNYVVELSASDSTTSGSLQFPITVNPNPGTVQGWIGAPLYGSTVTGIVPITLAQGIALQSGALAYYPASNPNNVIPLPMTALSGTISTLDTTVLANGSYWIQLQGTNTSGEFEYSLILVTVAGNYKPGRVTATVTDLVVPATGLAINIQRTYDSLNAGTSGDFGYGWNLGINVNLTVGPDGSVTFTLGGQRRTFYLTPQPNGFLPYYDVAFTPEPGFHGTLTDSAPGCQDLFDFVVPSGSLWYCVDGGQYNPPGYIYTDPNGTSYVIGAGGALQAIQGRSGNGLTITPNGIVSSTGLKVPFKRDAQNRIYEIDDPQGNQYFYGYNAKGELDSVTYPNTTQPSTYAYTPTGHYYLSGTDFRNNPLPVTAYYNSATDGGNSALDGRLLSVQDALGNTTSYAYNLSTTSIVNGVSVPNTGVTTITYPDNGVATMVYDSYGMLLSSTDPLGLTTTNVYDSKHNLTSVTDPLGHVNTYTYDQNGNKTSSTYPATATSTNTTSITQYNQYSEPTQTTDELGNVRLFNYDANYNPQSVTDSIGTLASFQFNSNQTLGAGAIGFDIATAPAKASQFTYDANGNLVGRTDALDRTTSFVYNSLGQKASVTTPTPTAPTGGPASTTNYTYDQLGNLTQTAAPLGRTTSSTYDGNGNKITDTDARGNVTKYQYDTLNRLIETDYPDGTKATKTYDFRSNVLVETDQNGNQTLHAYDLAGRQTKVTRGYGTSSASTTTYAYDNAGRKTSETDALGHSTAYTYDAAGNLTAIAGVKGNFTYTYDNARNRVSQTDARGNKTQFQYDARKRLTLTTYPDTTTTVNTYDGPGNLASVTDQAGNVIRYTYDAANQLKTVVQTASPSTSNNTNYYGYDPLGNLTNLTDENLHTTQNTFDLFNEPISKTLPAAQTETRNYDNAGNLTSLVHFNQVTTTYTYDTLNRLLSRATPGEATVSFTYTPSGKYLTSTAGDGTVNYSYDSLDRLTTKATPEGTLSYTYDAAGHVASILSSNANGASVSYAYDDQNRLSTVVDNRLSGNNTTTYTYDPASNLSTATYPNGVQSVLTYDALNRISGLATQDSGYLYQRGPTGNLTSATELNGRTVNWSFDGIYRLTNESITSDPDQVNGSVEYQLDPVGNRLSDTSSLTGINSGSFGYNADDEVSTEAYDQNGNTLSTGGKSFTYDAENHLTGMNASGTVVSIVYDAFGNRVSKTVNGATTKYLVEDDVNPTGYPQVLDELTGSAVTRTYTYGLQRISEDQIVNGTWTPSFYTYDGGGNVRQLTNLAGAVTDTNEYDAFGNLIASSGTTPNAYLYRGEQFDPDLGLYYLRARYYNPATGRFMSRDPQGGDPTNPASLHKYLYADGDPVNGVDRSGRADEEEQEGVISWITNRAATALATLTAGAAQAAATLQYYAGLAYLTLNDFLAALAANEYVGAITKTLGCITVGLMLDRMLNEVDLSEQVKYAALFDYKAVCTLVIVAPWNGPDPEGPWGGGGDDF
jgi:RHS repeat-associated protein